MGYKVQTSLREIKEANYFYLFRTDNFIHLKFKSFKAMVFHLSNQGITQIKLIKYFGIHTITIYSAEKNH